MDLDTFLTRLYVLIDDWYKGEMKELMQRHAGAELQMSDSEVLTLAIAGQWRVGVPWQSERGLLRFMHLYGRHWFPKLLQRSQFNKRVKQLWAALVRLQQVLADCLESEADLYEVVDCTELPHCSLAQAASHKRHWLAGKLGRGGNNGGWFYGEQVLVSASPAGVIRGWLLGLAQIDDRWMFEAFLSSRQGGMQLIGPAIEPKKANRTCLIPTIDAFSPAVSVGEGRLRPYLADKGFNGARWIEHWREFYQAVVITAPPNNVKSDFSLADEKWLSSHRQIIETVFARLTEVFGLKCLNAHSDWGKITRLAAKTAAYNLGIFFNRLLKRPDGALATLIQ
jgi:hypothetical protein